MDLNNKTIWITGASSGIGEALALQYAPLGYNLILSARRKTELEKVAEQCQVLGATCYVLPLDLADIKSPANLVNEAIAFTGKIDVLINNGGVSQRGLAAETSIEVVRKIMEVNFFGHVALSSSLLPHFIKAGGGQFAVLSSLTGKFGYGLRSTYAASKHALHGYFESLAIENFKNNVHVTMICPGRILTNISLNAITANGSAQNAMDDGQRYGIPAEVCANIIIKAIAKKKREILIGKKDKVMVFFKRFWPALFFKIAIKLDPRR
ncbi:MAG: SDR family oxidoreductase [Bacteroidia bacterium]